VRLTASFGLAAATDGVELGELIAGADAALYDAKRGGKNRVVVTAAEIV
jgi:PleD family two-component response regulator